jgi:hypothetical protein
MQHCDKTQNGQTTDTGNIEKRQRIEKPETQAAALKKDTQ